MSSRSETILVTGGAGYVGSILVPKLLQKGHRVRVLDLYLYGDQVFSSLQAPPGLEEVRGDIRDLELLSKTLRGCTAVIHLACISNDPSCDLDPALTRSINYEAFQGLLAASRKQGIQKFIFASSSSVYGISHQPHVTEDHPRVPVSDYNRYKALCEDLLMEISPDDLPWVSIRPATVCGYSPRLRLDLTVNILTNHAVNRGVITVFGGSQWRPNLHIEDMTNLYVQLMDEPQDRIKGKVYNVGYQNLSVSEIAQIVKRVVESRYPHKNPISIVTTPTDDLRSYRISCEKITRELNFSPKKSVEDAVVDLCEAFEAGRIPEPLSSSRYYNIQTMKEIGLK